jgi:hypothetical protein
MADQRKSNNPKPLFSYQTILPGRYGTENQAGGKRGDRDQSQGCSGPQVGLERKIVPLNLALLPRIPDEGGMNFR